MNVNSCIKFLFIEWEVFCLGNYLIFLKYIIINKNIFIYFIF